MFKIRRKKFQIHKNSPDSNPKNAGNLDLAALDQKKMKRCFLGQRHVVTLLGFLCCFLMNSDRVVLSVAIVAMVKHGQKNETSKWNASEVSCPLPSAPLKPVVSTHFEGEFDWSAEMQGYLLSIGFLSYLITHTPAGRLADAVGSKSLLVYSNAVAGILIIISPVAARWHVYALLAIQLLRGSAQGVTSPSIYKMMSNWIPRVERGTLNTLATCGYTTGTALTGVVTGWLCDIPGLGWQSAFYLSGSFSVVIAILIHFIYFEHPVNHPWITQGELKYITEGLETKVSEKQPPTPWKKMLSSIPTYAYFYGLFGLYWETTYFITVHPTFMKTVLHYSTAESGFISCLPVLISTASGVLSSIVAYWVSKKNLISLNMFRKITTGISAFGFSLCMAGILITGCNTIGSNLCFALSLFATGIALSGVMIAGVDMAPKFAGSFMGVASNIAGIGSVVIPVVTGLITTHETLSEWQNVFWLNLVIVGSSGLVYVLFGSAEVQDWNYPDDEYPIECTNKETGCDIQIPNHHTGFKEMELEDKIFYIRTEIKETTLDDKILNRPI